MAMSITDLIYAKTGIAVDLPSLVNDPDARRLVASLMALVASSDGDMSPYEIARMVEMLRERFHLKTGEALDLVTRATEELVEYSRTDELLEEVNRELALPHKEDLMLMVLGVIAADSQKAAEEIKLLAALIDGLNMPDNIMEKVYTRYFRNRKEQEPSAI